MQRALLPAGGAATSGHVTLLKQKVLTAILRRLDALLFGKLLAGEPTASPHAVQVHQRLFFESVRRFLAGSPPAGSLSERRISIETSTYPPCDTPGEMDGSEAAARDGASVWSGDLDSLLSDGNISLDPDLLPFPRGRCAPPAALIHAPGSTGFQGLGVTRSCSASSRGSACGERLSRRHLSLGARCSGASAHPSRLEKCGTAEVDDRPFRGRPR